MYNFIVNTSIYTDFFLSFDTFFYLILFNLTLEFIRGVVLKRLVNWVSGCSVAHTGRLTPAPSMVKKRGLSNVFGMEWKIRKISHGKLFLSARRGPSRYICPALHFRSYCTLPKCAQRQQNLLCAQVEHLAAELFVIFSIARVLFRRRGHVLPAGLTSPWRQPCVVITTTWGLFWGGKTGPAEGLLFSLNRHCTGLSKFDF